MRRPMLTTFAATIFVAVSLALWRVAYTLSDWAALALLPISAAIIFGAWPLALRPWRARLELALRQDSPLRPWLTGHLRAGAIAVLFTGAAVFLLAWQAVHANQTSAVMMLTAFFLSGFLFSVAQVWFARHLHQPFATSAATSLVTWMVGVPFILMFAVHQYFKPSFPEVLLEADLRDAIELGMAALPDREGWVTGLMSVAASLEAMKIWLIVQLKDYPLVAAAFSLDAALFGFVLCRSAVLVTQAIGSNIFGERN